MEAKANEMWYQSPETWVAVAFAIFVLLSLKYLVPLIGKMLDGRAAQIREQLEQASRLREEAEALLASYQTQQQEALKEAEHILEAARKDADNIRERAAEDLKLSLARRTQQAQEKIARAEQDAVALIRTQIIENATAAARETIVQRLSSGQEDPAVQNALSAITRQIH